MHISASKAQIQQVVTSAHCIKRHDSGLSFETEKRAVSNPEASV